VSEVNKKLFVLCVVLSFLFILSTEGFCKGGSSSGGFSGGRSGGFSSSARSSSGGYGSIKNVGNNTKSPTGGVSGKSSIGDMSKSTGVKMNTSKYHSTPTAAVTSPRSGRVNDRLTTVAPPVTEKSNYISYVPVGQSTPHYYRAYPQETYSSGGTGIPTWFWIWWMTSGNNQNHYRHDQQSGMLVKETTNKETGQKTQTYADPEEFEEESSGAMLAFGFLTLFVLVGIGVGVYLFIRKKMRDQYGS